MFTKEPRRRLAVEGKVAWMQRSVGLNMVAQQALIGAKRW